VEGARGAGLPWWVAGVGVGEGGVIYDVAGEDRGRGEGGEGGCLCMSGPPSVVSSSLQELG